MFHRTSRFVFPFELTIDIRYLNVFTFCLWMEFGRDARKDNIYIYIFISRIQWRTRSIFKDKPSFATVDRNLQSLAFHAWNFIFSRVYASAIYIYINIFPREENTSDGIRIPPPNNLPPRNRYSKIIFIIREFLLRCETPITSEKKNVLLLGKKCPFSSQCVVVALNRKRVKKKKEEEEKWKG